MLEALCLAAVLYHEARGEPKQGQLAVAEVVLNRVDHPFYPSTVCSVIKQANQFVHRGPVREKKTYDQIVELAESVINNDVELPGLTSTHFYSGNTPPYWARAYTKDTRIGNHVFFTVDKARWSK